MLLLILFKEWRQRGDLKGPYDLWIDSLRAFEESCGYLFNAEVHLLKQWPLIKHSVFSGC